MAIAASQFIDLLGDGSMHKLSGIIVIALGVGLVVTRSAAEEPFAGIWPKLKVDKTGEFKDPKTKKYLGVRIKELVTGNTMIVEIGKDEPAFIVKGLSIKEFADDTVIEMRGEWKVTRTGQLGVPKRTLFVVEPVDKDKASFALPEDEKATGIWPRMKVGKSGEFKDPKTKKLLDVRVQELLSVNMMLVAIGKDEPAFIVKGLPTKGLMSGSQVELKGEWTVVKTSSLGKSNKSHYIVEQVMKK